MSTLSQQLTPGHLSVHKYKPHRKCQVSLHSTTHICDNKQLVHLEVSASSAEQKTDTQYKTCSWLKSTGTQVVRCHDITIAKPFQLNTKAGFWRTSWYEIESNIVGEAWRSKNHGNKLLKQTTWCKRPTGKHWVWSHCTIHFPVYSIYTAQTICCLESTLLTRFNFKHLLLLLLI